MLYALADTLARHYGNLNHLQISLETNLTRPPFFSPPPPLLSPPQRPKSNLIMPYCFSCPTIKELAGGRGDLTQLLGYFFPCAAMAGAETRRDGRRLSKCLLMMKRENPICSHKATSLQLC